jgi:3-hydroxyacyl-CoA dehydrogenase
MHYADTVGLRHIAGRLNFYADQTGDENLRPAALLQRLADKGEGFSGKPREKAA